MRIWQNARGHAGAFPCGLAFPPRPSHVTRGPPDQLGGSKVVFGELGRDLCDAVVRAQKALDRRPIYGRAARSRRS